MRQKIRSNIGTGQDMGLPSEEVRTYEAKTTNCSGREK